MSKPAADLKTALSRFDDAWTEQRTERSLAGAHHKLLRRKRRSLLLGATAAVACLSGTGFWLLRTEPTRSASVVTASGTDSQRMQLADGSAISLPDSTSRVVVKEVSAARMTVELASGRARFDVVHRDTRVFRVLCGEVEVEVLGTSFELERAGARTRVAVEHGRVAVVWSAGRTELSTGEVGWFPKNDPAEESAPPHSDAEPPSAKRSAAKPHSVAMPSSWREPAEHGDFAHAYELLRQTKQPPVDDVEELLLAADTARLSGHPEAALPFLKRVVTNHAHDSRAPLAAFTLGSVLMQQLSRPHDAEIAYGQARALSLNSSLAQDALARQVEAAHRSGDAARARSLAEEYLARYPNGRRVHAVRGFAGLEPE